jgi:hypothetical protein
METRSVRKGQDVRLVGRSGMTENTLARAMDMLVDVRAERMAADEWEVVAKTLADLAAALRDRDWTALAGALETLDEFLAVRVEVVTGNKKDEPPDDRLLDRIDTLVELVTEAKNKERNRR